MRVWFFPNDERGCAGLFYQAAILRERSGEMKLGDERVHWVQEKGNIFRVDDVVNDRQLYYYF